MNQPTSLASVSPRWVMVLSLVATLAIGACGPSPNVEAPLVVATTTIHGDLVRNVVGDRARVEVLIPTGADPHDHQLSAAQAAMLRSADLVVANGLGLESQMRDALDAAKAEGVAVLELTPELDPIPLEEHHDEGDMADDDHGELDPHFWHDAGRMARAAELVGARLASVLPDDELWLDAGRAYAEELRALDAELELRYHQLSPDRRVLVTNHDSLGYLAHRYGFRIVATVIPGGSTLAEPSAAQLAQLVQTLKETGAPAIFTEALSGTSRMAEAVAAELDRQIRVVEIHTDSLGPDGSGAETYIQMMRSNAERIIAALEP